MRSLPGQALSTSQARRIALAAQGLTGARRPGRVSARRLIGVVERLGVVQIDSVNAVARAHLAPFFTRLGDYDVAVLRRAASRPPRGLLEYWAHEASLVTPEVYRLLGWRRARWREHAWGSMVRAADHAPELLERLVGLIGDGGPATSRELAARLGPDARPAEAKAWGWNWSLAKAGLEALFYSGRLAVAGRTAQFERRYDLAERVLPPTVLDAPEPPAEQARRELLARAGRALGVATEASLRDYFRMTAADARRALGALVEDGTLTPVAVEGWTRPGYLHRDAVLPRHAERGVLLCPFDPLIFHRERAAELFGYDFRLEIYVPAAKRRWGYYVYSFLLGERFAARVDLRAERGPGVLRVAAAHAEPGAPADTAARLAVELRALAAWLGLGEVAVAPLGDLAPALAAELRR